MDRFLFLVVNGIFISNDSYGFIVMTQDKGREKCCGKCKEYGLDGGNLCERYLICDENCTYSMPNNTPKWEESLKDLPRKTINGCWYVELGSVENVIKNEILPQARAETIEQCIKIIREYPLQDWSGEAEVYEEIENIAKRVESTLKEKE